MKTLSDYQSENRKLKRGATFLLFFCLALFALVAIQFRSAKNQENYRLQENLRFQASLQLKRQEVIKADSVVKRLEDQMTIDSTLHRMAVNALKSRIKRLTSNLPVLEPISPHEDSICDRFVASTLKKDTIIATQDTLINKLEDRSTELVGSFRAIIAQKDTVIKVQTEIAGMWEGQADNFEQAFRKADKKAKRKFSVGPNISYSVTKEGLSPSFGVGIMYSLFKF